jgi:ABC-type Fe3+/spermidine/putrescine transport system ATPase subunit
VQLEIRRLHTKNRRTTIYVTHDQEEALVMSDRIGLMRAGRIEQIGTADELYRRPVSTFAAGFLGESNLLRGKVVRLDREQAVLRVPQLGLEIAGDAADGLREGQEAAALIRPEHLRLDGEGNGDGNGDGGGARASVVEVVYLGDLLSIRLELSDGTSVWSRRFANQGIPATESVGLGWDRSDVRILPDT